MANFYKINETTAVNLDLVKMLRFTAGTEVNVPSVGIDFVGEQSTSIGFDSDDDALNEFKKITTNNK